MRVIFFGTSAFAVPSLQRLAARHTVVLCVTQPDRPRGRGLVREPSPVKQAAVKLGVPLAQPARLTMAALESVQADLGAVASYGQLIRREVLEYPAHGILGVHPSLLPKYRGAAPVAWALLRGETVTGATIFRLNEALDAGELISRRETAIEPHEDAAALMSRLAKLGAEELLNAVDLVASGRAVFAPQDDTQATLAPKLTKAQGRIDWSRPAEEIDRLIRAVVPWPGAVTTWQGATLKMWSAQVVAGPTQITTSAPGTVLAVTEEGLVIATGRGMLRITELQLPGKRRVSAKEFLAGHRVQVGDRLGA